MLMSDLDVVKYYNELSDKRSAVRIIAELNAAPQYEVKDILDKHGVQWRKGKVAET